MMKNDPETRKKRVMRRMKISGFLQRNGVYIAVFVCLAMLGGLIAALPSGRSAKQNAEEPAAHSLDETLSGVKSTNIPIASLPPRQTAAPSASAAPTLAPTVMPELTPAPSSEPAPTSASKLNSPVDGRLIRPYSMDALIYSKTLRQWMTHSGVDIAAPKGTEVRAVAAGTVKRVYEDDMMGVCVLIDHGEGMSTLCCGLKSEPPVNEGDKLNSRALIGYVGDTAISECAEQSHLHFEVWKDGLPIDPEAYVFIAKEG